MINQFSQKAFRDTLQAVQKRSSDHLPHLLTGLDGSARAIFLAQLLETSQEPLLIIEPSDLELQSLAADLSNLLSDFPVLVYPAEDSIAIEYAEASLDFSAQRVEVLNFLASGSPGIVLTNVAGGRQALNSLEDWKAYNQDLRVGEDYERDRLIQSFEDLRYRSQALVTAPGEYSVRGGIVDFYPLNSDYPIRLDFFDTELDSIRYFNDDSQESIENIPSVRLSPVKEVVLPLAQQQALYDQIQGISQTHIKKIKDSDLAEQMKLGITEELEKLSSGDALKYPAAFLSLSQDPAYLLDYLSPKGFLIVNDYAKLIQKEEQMVEENQFWIEQEVAKGKLLPGLKLKGNLVQEISQVTCRSIFCSVLQRGYVGQAFESVHHYNYQTMNPFFGQIPALVTDLQAYLKQGYQVQIVMGHMKQAHKLTDQLRDAGFDQVSLQEDQVLTDRVGLVQGQLSKGFALPDTKWAVLTESDLFTQLKRPSGRLRQPHLSNAERLKSYNELKPGDYVVHLNHGVGQYTGMETMEVNGVHRDLLAIEYQNKARVLIPVEKINLIQKYVASESKTPKINKLGGTDWAKTKQRVQSRVEDIADDLIKLYAQRESEKGYAFGPDTPEQADFEGQFNFVETPDQVTSSQEIKKDMEKDRPMDRLLVGDVGYGKTEVAMRAIFKAVIEGKQVAFLVPTTVLAQQHYNTLVERFADWPFEIGLLSRFVSKGQQQETIKKLKSGQLSILVGTHRLLSKDIRFNDLGLLVVDEEQRFGVKHKERLKQLKAQVDVLTLTATPIPRTLHMSMIGVRDLSVIETPPSNRFPVQTYILEKNEGAIKSAIEREMARGGQVFYLYNRVASIYQRADELSDLVPQARVAVAHGQMSETDLETVLVDFIQGRYDVLVTTTIIETGVDIPNANTLFIENADKMGLSTLYQLRGRVGRTHRVAYAYLMYEPFKNLTEVSEKRLKAIREFTDLGSGFKIAMRDLSIRGAGNLLGQQQSGFIDSVGYDLYTQMLKEAVDRRRGVKQAETKYRSQGIEWNIDLDAYIPTNYISDDRQKINMYKAIQAIDSLQSYQALQDQLIDRYGEFPDEVADLLEVALIKHYGIHSGVEEINKVRGGVEVVFNTQASSRLQGPNIFQALQDVPLKADVKVNRQQLKVILWTQGKANDQWLSALRTLTQEVTMIMEGKEVS